METLLVFMAIALVVGVPLAIIALTVRVFGLGRRLRAAEQEIAQMRGGVSRAPDDGSAPFAAQPATETKPVEKAAPWGPAAGQTDDPLPVIPLPDTGPNDTDAPVFISQTSPANPPRPIRSGPNLVDRAIAWLSVNWFYAVAAASLALAGIFLVQYGAEQGLLPPPVRVIAALIFGAGLIAGGELIRRRFGDGEDVATAYLPSVLSGAGVVTLFGAVLGARHLYDLIGQGATLGAMSVIALGAIVLGWFHGPLLVAVGLIGGAVTPFVVGGGRGADLRPLHGYFLILTVMGLSIDAVRRWRGRWVSGLALAIGLGASTLLALGNPDTVTVHLMAVTGMALAAMALPIARLQPDHAGPMVLTAACKGYRAPLENLLAFAAVSIAAALAVLGAAEALWPAIAVQVLLFVAVALWAQKAEGLQDAALAPALGMLAIIAEWPAPDGAAAITLALLAGGTLSFAALLRSFRDTVTHRLGWALATVLIAPATGLALHLAWAAPSMMGAYVWALHALAVAAGLTVAAGVWASMDGEDRLRPSLAALVAVTLIAYALGQVAGEAALTASVALIAAGAAWLDRRFNLPLLSWFVVLAAPFTFWRLMGVPGLEWHLETPILPALLSMVGSAAGFGLAALWLRQADPAKDRPEPLAVAESAALAAIGYTASILLWRALAQWGADPWHLRAGLTALIWLILAWAQFEVWARGGRMPWLRLGLTAAFGGIAGLALVAGLTFGNPLFTFPGVNSIAGWPVLNTLIPGYLLPALLLLAVWWRMAHLRLSQAWTLMAAATGCVLAGVWAVLTIRHFWQGADRMSIWKGAMQPEITTYTIALLILGAALFYQGVARRSDLWRRAGTAVLAVTMLKVFLIDVWSLDGLLRVGALIALATAMGGLAWLYRWAGGTTSAPASPVQGLPSDAPRDGGQGPPP
ncbi:DUF2339 domain-containing protein [Jannaschia helgolandensis]|uniref:DUF2339 domain-containing protein n=1 Tax=Jannaschia helgolandensis TaxID=188906 RepID=UPI0030DD203C